MAVIEEIGVVRNKFTESTDPFVMRREISTIEIHDAYAEGLYDIESNEYLQILFHFHQSSEYRLQGRWYFGDTKGVFSSRSPKRPGAIGLTTVKLLKREGNLLTVSGLDALDGTPVLDIKPFAVGTDLPSPEKMRAEFTRSQPKARIIPQLKNGDLAALLTDAGALHGHYCPGLAAGVLASFTAMKHLAVISGNPIELLAASRGFEQLVSVIEINSCFADGVQHVTGCTLGNNSLVYKDLGKTALTCALRGTSYAVRVVMKPGFEQMLREMDPEFSSLFDRVVREHEREEQLMRSFSKVSNELSFSLLEMPAENVFEVSEADIELPDYAQMENSVLCRSCGEEVMETKTEEGLCRDCAKTAYGMVDGSGVRTIRRNRI
jgi:formylmethanofuran dehydrogenase subunit E